MRSAAAHEAADDPAAAERGFGPDSREASAALNNLGVCYKYPGGF